ncbi:hypothetical protein GCM10009853_077190 [Glycomyces scopariae]
MEAEAVGDLVVEEAELDGEGAQEFGDVFGGVGRGLHGAVLLLVGSGVQDRRGGGCGGLGGRFSRWCLGC